MHTEKIPSVSLQTIGQKLVVTSPIYGWEWDGETDSFSLIDAEQHLISKGRHQPLIITTGNRTGGCLLARQRDFRVENNRATILYSGLNGDATLTVVWNFYEDFITLECLRYESPEAEELVQAVYFAEPSGNSSEQGYSPSLYSRYVVVPGLCMSPSVSPIVDLHSRLSVNAVLGSGAMRGPGLTQQWGLPAHYFCAFNTADQWNAIGARSRQSAAVCWGLRELPQADYRLEIREGAISPVLNLRSDIWKHLKTPGAVELGFAFMITFGTQYHTAIRNYYTILAREKIVNPKRDTGAPEKNKVLLAPQYNTWGVESSKALKPEALTEALVLEILEKLRLSGMKARTFVIDDKWESHYGELKHDEVRFPHFEALLEKIRGEGYFLGLWAAFLRCQDPTALGLNESHLLQTPEGGPLWLVHQASRYGIFDVTQPAVQHALQERARQFMRRYRPDLIKFDFGYELPSLDVAAPADLRWAGERLLQKGLEVVVGAMKAENPNLVIMYYGLSPLLLDYYDLHSPDDLVYCGGDYDLETNRRIFFSSLCGELGLPTYGSSGYDWASAPDIWFDSAPSGTLGSLHCFDGDENGDLPRAEWIAKFNGLSAILRHETTFTIQPIDASWQGGLRAAFSPSWERLENGKTVLLALRTHKFDGKPASQSYKDVLHTTVGLVVASLDERSLAESGRLGLVPFGDGICVLEHLPASANKTKVLITEHYLGGGQREDASTCQSGRLELTLRQTRADQILEWLEIVFSTDKNIL
jgi:hypothetical protein